METDVRSTPNFGGACQLFVQAGIPLRALLPIAPLDAAISEKSKALKAGVLGKSPGRYFPREGVWSGLGGNAVDQGMDPEDRDKARKWPTGNVGVLGRFAPGIDSDAESEDARRFVEGVLCAVYGNTAPIAERLRGDGPRRLYAFKSRKPGDDTRVVRTRHIHYRMPGDDDHAPVHKLDILGAGSQYLIAGEHKSGDHYEWHREYGLIELFTSDEILQVDDADIERFLEEFASSLKRIGGKLLQASGGAAPGEERDYSGDEPVFPVKDIFDGLERIPNNAANFATRDDLVKALSAIRAALGAEAEENREHVEAWACEDSGWCDAEYFEKIWESLRRGVRVDRFALDRLFRKHRVNVSARHEFQGDTDALMAPVRAKNAEDQDKADKLLGTVAAGYVFGRVNTDTKDDALRVRRKAEPGVEIKALDWWRCKADYPDVGLLQEIQEHGRWPANETGLWNFIRDLRQKYPGAFYISKTRHPGHDFGEIVIELKPDGSETRLFNERYISQVIRFGRKKSRNPKQARQDLNLVLDFMARVFGSMLNYELDTLAYMAQTGKRPGHMLFLVGDQGVGKSIYADMLVSIFDGVGQGITSRIDGTKMTNEAARRFVLAGAEGCRILSVKELPDGSTAANMAAVTSSLKQIVDPGPDGDYFQIEGKNKDNRGIRNFARVITTSNYNNSLKIEDQDRRIFYVWCGINPDNKPDPEYYGGLTGVTTDPERLATVWRFLLEREISHYQVAKAPPVTREKREAQIAGIADPAERHMRAALETLRAHGREFFDTKELASIMTAMGENEWRNTNGAVDDRAAYDFGESPSMAKRLNKQATQVRVVKSNGTRVATVYGLRTARPAIDRLASASGPDVMDALDRDRDGHPLSRDHVLSAYAGPITPASAQQR